MNNQLKDYLKENCLHYYIDNEFDEDFARFKYIKKLINRFLDGEDLQSRNILNHLIVLKNIFKIEACLKVFEIKYSLRQLMVLKPFLLLLKYIDIYDYPNIPLDIEAIEACRKLKNVS